jgi:aspartate/methionine/tyrosine aminotransferase
MDTLPAIGLKARKPQGAMFVWAEVEEGSGQSYVEAALKHAHVSLTPGQAFGPGAAQYVRISLGMQDDQLQLALDRLNQWYSAR